MGWGDVSNEVAWGGEAGGGEANKTTVKSVGLFIFIPLQGSQSTKKKWQENTFDYTIDERYKPMLLEN